MNTIISADKYKELVLTLYKLIEEEISNVSDLEQQYPKFILMYEFFRLLRGEAFADLREPDLDFQKKMYEMEDALFNKVKGLKASIPGNSDRVKFFYDNLVSIGLRV